MALSYQVPYVNKISMRLLETTISHRCTSPVYVMRLSRAVVTVPLGCVGVASVVGRIAHSVIKAVVKLYMLSKKRQVGKDGDFGGVEFYCTCFDLEALYT
jgi:hypothetical protein